MDSKKLKLLAKLATSALAVNALGVGTQVSAMEQASTGLTTEEKDAINYNLDCYLARLSEQGQTKFETKLRRILFLLLLIGVVLEYGSHYEQHEENMLIDLRRHVTGKLPNSTTDKRRIRWLTGWGESYGEMCYIPEAFYAELEPLIKDALDELAGYDMMKNTNEILDLLIDKETKIQGDEQDKELQGYGYGSKGKEIVQFGFKDFPIKRKDFSNERRYADFLIRKIRHNLNLYGKAKPNRQSECPICFEKFKDIKGKREICRLPCGHVFCKDCIEPYEDKYMRANQTSGFPCPICKTVFSNNNEETVTFESLKSRRFRSKSFTKKSNSKI